MHILKADAWSSGRYLRTNFAEASGQAADLIEQHQRAMFETIKRFPPMVPHFEMCQTHGFIERTLTTGVASIICPRTNMKRYTAQSSLLRLGPTHYVVYHFIDGPRIDLVMGYIYNFPLFLLFPDTQCILLIGGSTINTEVDHLEIARACMQVDLSGRSSKIKPVVWALADQNSLGHSYWQNGTGYDFLKKTGLINYVSGRTPIKYDFYRIGDVLENVEGIKEHGDTDALFFCLSDFVISKSSREELLRSVDDETWLRHQPKSSSMSVLLQVRSGFRRWESQTSGIASMIDALVQQFPGIEVIVDGRSTWRAYVGAEDGYQVQERAMFEEILSKTTNPDNVISTIGWDVVDKISKFSHLDAFCAPIGSGTTIPYWILNKRGVVYGPPAMYGWSKDQAEYLIEDIRQLSWLPAESVQITTPADEPRNSDFDVDWKQLLHLLLVEIERAQQEKNSYWKGSL